MDVEEGDELVVDDHEAGKHDVSDPATTANECDVDVYPCVYPCTT